MRNFLFSGIIIDPVARTDTIRNDELQSLWNEGKKLEFSADDEEQQLQFVVDFNNCICEELRDFLSNIKISPLFSTLIEHSRTRGTYSCPYKPEEIENMVCAQLPRVLPKLSVEESVIALQSIENFYETVSNVPEAEDEVLVIPSLNELAQGKLSIDVLRSRLELAHRYKSKLNEITFLDEVFITVDNLNKKMVAITNSFFYQRDKSKVDPNRKRFDWGKIVKFFKLVLRYPLKLPSTENMLQMVTIVQDWRNEVQRLGHEVEAKTTNSSKRNPRSSSKKDSKSLPLKRIESLLYEGDHFPFSFPQEMTILREQREQAKLLIKKLRESLETTRRKNKNRSGEDDSNGANKMVYSEFKHLLMEGESFYLGGDEGGEERAGGSRAVQKDLDRAQSVMEIAEDWLSNVREMITSHFEFEARLSLNEPNMIEESVSDQKETTEDILIRKRIELVDSLREQLGEADSLPFTLEEADVVRFQLQAIEWAAKSRPWLMHIDASLGSKALPRFIDAVQMRDEITKYVMN